MLAEIFETGISPEVPGYDLPVSLSDELPGPLGQNVALILRERMKARGLTQTRLGQLAGKSQGSVSKYLSGEMTYWDLETLDALCVAMGTTLEDVIAAARG